MVCLCVVGGCLSEALKTLFDEASETYAKGDLSAATLLYREILDRAPHHPDALLMLGVLAQRANKVELALALFNAALTAEPLFPRAQYNKSVVLRLLGRDQEALEAARSVTENEPQLAEAWDVLGQILKDQGSYEEATNCFKKALALQPHNPHFHGNFALLLLAKGNKEDAFREAQRAELLDPSYPPMLLGNILQALGYPEKAAERFSKTRVLRPNFKEGAAVEAMAKLQMGDMEEGWALWEKRPDLGADSEPALKEIPLWQGEKTAHLLLYEDQGLGDAIQFARYIPSLQSRALNITLRIREPLYELFAENFQKIAITLNTNSLPWASARCRLSSLPFFFETRLKTIPSFPYLAASIEKRSYWRNCLKQIEGLKIGLAWAGNKKFRHDRDRSIDLKFFEPLIFSTRGHLVSLQKDRLDDTPIAREWGILDETDRLTTFADTAALIAELDLVITVDTAIAHLAGALGKSVFLLLPFSSDWRWLLGRSDSPWYKTARLFRQKRVGDWEGTLKEVLEELEKLMGGDKSVLRPPSFTGDCLRQNPDALPLPL